MFIYKAGVVGAGAMGAGIAQVIAFSGLPVVIKDVNQEVVDKGIATVRKIFQGRVDKGKMTSSELDQKMKLVTGTTSYDDFKDCDIVIEAVFENMDVKKRIFQELEAVLPECSIMATNTSALSISELAASVKRSDKVVGIHFFNPAPVMKLIEVIPGLQTAPDTVDTAIEFAQGLRKMPVRVKECAGFLVNRLLMPYLNEAVHSLEDSQMGVEMMDQTMRELGMPMGPFALADLLGLDVCSEVAEILYKSFGPRMEPSSILRGLLSIGHKGVKSGNGFYQYGELENKSKAIIRMSWEGKLPGRSFIPARLLYQMINEAAYCLEENVASPGDIDLAMLAGAGMAKGPLHLADEVGLDVVLERLEEFSREYGPRFWPAPLLRRMVAANYLGQKTKKGFFTY